MAASLDRADIAAYKAAFELARKKNWSAAYQHATKADHPLARKILRWLKMTQSENSYSFPEIAEFMNNNPDWPLPRTLRSRAEEAITVAELTEVHV